MTTFSDRVMALGPFRADSGSKVHGSVRVELGSTTVGIPLTLVNGTRPGPRIVITGGVHGGEFTGVAAATRLSAELDPEDVRGQLVVCPVANPPAVYQGRLGVSPLDGLNINRVFPGDPIGGPTERLAAWLFENLLTGADAYIDLHSGAIDETLRDFVGYRLSGDEEVDAKARAMAHAVGIDDVIVGLNADGGNSHAAAARQGIPAILVETGQLGQRDPAIVGSLLDGLYRLLRQLNVLDRTVHASPAPPVREWVWAGAVTAEATGLWYPQFTAGDDVSASQVIGHIVDPADGEEHEVSAPVSGRVFYGMYGLTVEPGSELAAIAVPHAQENDRGDE